MTGRIDVVFDLPAGSRSHDQTLAALSHADEHLEAGVATHVVRTTDIGPGYFDDLPGGFVIGPGAPYNAPANAELVIATARERGIPLVGT